MSKARQIELLGNWMLKKAPELDQGKKFASALLSDEKIEGKTNLYKYTVLKRIYQELGGAEAFVEGGEVAELAQAVKDAQDEAWRGLPGELLGLIPLTPPDWADLFNSVMYIGTGFSALQDEDATKEELWNKMQEDQSWWGKLKTAWGNFVHGVFDGKEDDSDDPEPPDDGGDVFNTIPPPSEAVVELKERPNQRRDVRLRWQDENGEVPPPDENDEKEGWVRYRVLTGEGQKLETDKSWTIGGNVINLGTFKAVHNTTLTGPVIRNDGAIAVNSSYSGSAVMVAESDVKLTGTGKLKLSRESLYMTSLKTTNNNTITNDSKHTISGCDLIYANLINEGTINADVKGETLYLSENNKANNNIITASNGGILSVRTTIANNGTLIAGGGTIEIHEGGKVIGGVLNSKGKSAIISKSGAIEDITNKGQFNIEQGTTTIAGKSLTNNGTIAINAATMVADSDIKLTGTGELKLNQKSPYAASLKTSDDSAITNDTKHTISGNGYINADLINKGIINADVRDKTLSLLASNKANNNIITASNGGILSVRTTITNNGTLIADGGTIEIHEGGKVIGGVLNSKGKSVIISKGGAIEDITNKGQFNIEQGTTTIAGKNLTNNGTIAINSSSWAGAGMVADSDVKLTGTGELKLNRGGSSYNAQLNTTDNSTITNDTKHTITGKGQINAPLTNKGTIAPGIGIGTLNLNNNYQQLKTGVLNIELGQKGNDRLDISGTATLDGTIDIDILGNFAPKPGDTFTILTADQIQGKFTKIKDPTTKNGITLNPQITEDGLILTATADNQSDNNGVTKTGNNKNNRLKGSQRDDILDGKGGNDKLYGQNGDDTLIGGGGKDKLYGGKGDDTYQLDAKKASGSQIIDPKGKDTLKLDNANISLNGLAKGKTGFAAKGKNLVIDINQDGKANNRDLTIKNFFANNKANKPGKGFIETVDNVTGEQILNSLANPAQGVTKNGNNKNNTLKGSNKDDLLNGKGGNDKLLGNGGDDTLIGGTGKDKLTGGAGDDILTGGKGSDRFIFDTGRKYNQDTIGRDEIADFVVGQKDKIVLDTTTFTQLKPNQNFSKQFAKVTSDKAATTSDAYIVYNSNNGHLFYNANGDKAGLGAGGLFATLEGAPELDAKDFNLV